MMYALKCALLVTLGVTAFGQTRTAAPAITITDGGVLAAGRVNTIVFRADYLQNGFRVFFVNGGRSTPLTSLGRAADGRYSATVPPAAVPPLAPAAPPYSAMLQITNPNGQSGSAPLRVVPFVTPVSQLRVVPRVAAGETNTVGIPGLYFEEGVRVFWNQFEQKAEPVSGGLNVYFEPPAQQVMPYVAQLAIINPGGLRTFVNVQVVSAVPVIDSIDGEVTAGENSTITIRGAKFQLGLKVYVGIPPNRDVDVTGGVKDARPDTLVLDLKMPSVPTPPYQARLIVSNPMAASAPKEFQVLAPKIQPSITGVDPPSISARQKTKLTVTGTGFQKGLQTFVSVGGAETELTQSTVVVSDTQLTIEMTAPDVTASQVATLRISNPGGAPPATRDFVVQPQ